MDSCSGTSGAGRATGKGKEHLLYAEASGSFLAYGVGHHRHMPEIEQVIPNPSRVLGRISPIFPPFFPVFCAFSPSRRGGSNEPKTGTQGHETVSRAPKQRFSGLANSGCSERMGAGGGVARRARGMGLSPLAARRPRR